MSADRSRDNEESSRLEESKEGLDVSRRTFLRLGALAGAGASVPGLWSPAAAAANGITTDQQQAQTIYASTSQPDVEAARRRPADDIEEVTIAELQAAMTGGGLTSLQLVNLYLERIAALDQAGPNVNSVIEVNPQARDDRPGARPGAQGERAARGRCTASRSCSRTTSTPATG